MKKLPAKPLLITLSTAACLLIAVLIVLVLSSTPETGERSVAAPAAEENQEVSASPDVASTAATGSAVSPQQSASSAAPVSPLGKGASANTAAAPGPDAPAPVSGVPGNYWGDRLIEAGELIETRETTDARTGRPRTLSLYRTAFKHPLVLVEEFFVGNGHGGYIPQKNFMVGDHVIVEVAEGMSHEQAISAFSAAGLEARQKMINASIYLVTRPHGEVTTETVKSLLTALDPAITKVVEPDYLVFSTLTPNDSQYNEMWGLNNTGQTGGVLDADIDAPEAWEFTTGSSDVVVGVIDSGTDLDHPDLINNLWENPGEIPDNDIDDDGNGFVDDVYGYDFYDYDPTPEDAVGHGTHVAGTIGADTNNGIGVAGVAWDVQLMTLRFLGPNNSGSIFDAVSAVNYATLEQVDLTNNSWGGGPPSDTLQAAIRNGGLNNILFVAASGNSNLNTDVTPQYPAAYDDEAIVSVAASTHRDLRPNFSNYGARTVDLAAPGEDIRSTYLGGGYADLQGTSMASPHVAGAAALIRSAIPGMPIEDLKKVLLDTVDETSAFRFNTVSGGRLNLQRALSTALQQQISLRIVNYRQKTGNDDGVFNPGEVATFDVRIFNTTDGPIDLGTMLLNRGAVNDNIAITPDTGVLPGTIASRQQIILTEAFDLTFAGDVPVDVSSYIETLTLVLPYNTSTQPVEVELSVEIAKSSTVSGNVINSEDNLPVSNARVRYLRRDDGFGGQVRTDVNGDYAVVIPNGTFDFSADAAGFKFTESQEIIVPNDAPDTDFILEPADFGLVEDEIFLQARQGGSDSDGIELFNDGDLPVTWEISEVSAQKVNEVTGISSEMSLAGVQIATYLNHYTYDYAPFLSQLRQRGATVEEVSFNTDGDAALAGYDMVILDDRIIFWRDPTTAINTVNSFVNNGGGLFLMADDGGNYSKIQQLLQGTGITSHAQPKSSSSFNLLGSHYTTADVSQIRMSSIGHYFTTQGSGPVPLASYNGVSHSAVATELGTGRIVVVGGEIAASINQNTLSNRRFAHQTVDWLGLDVDWLSVNKYSGVVQPGTNTFITVAANARSLNPGLYEATIKIVHDNPEVPPLEVDVDFDVSGIPQLAVLPLSVDFGQTLTTGSKIRTLSLNNPGTGPLEITEANFTSSEFSFDTSLPITIPAGDSTDVQISFSPTITGVQNDELIFVTNEATVTTSVPVTGEGVSTLPVSVSLSTITKTMAPDTQEIEQLDITNASGGSITWSLAIEETTASGSSLTATAAPTWLSSSSSGGTLTDSENIQVDLTFDTNSLDDGAYTALLIIGTDTTGVDFTIPIDLTVESGGSSTLFPQGDYQTWLDNGIGRGANTGIYDDFDQDGIINGWEFLRGTDAGAPDANTAGLQIVNAQSGNPDLMFQKSAGVSTGVFRIYTSTDISNWTMLQPGQDFEELPAGASLTPGTENVILRINTGGDDLSGQAADDTPQTRFFRLGFQIQE